MFRPSSFALQTCFMNFNGVTVEITEGKVPARQKVLLKFFGHSLSVEVGDNSILTDRVSGCGRPGGRGTCV